MNALISDAVMRGIAYIEENLRNTIGVSDVADAVSYSQFYFSREFSKHTHIPVYDYILRRKLSEAYKCLFGTGPKIVELAFLFGFQSHEVFTRAFRKMFGENPSEASVYKPLTVFEAIDGRYLEFLYGLTAEFPGEPAREIFFEVDSGPVGRGEAALMQLDAGNYYECGRVYPGRLSAAESAALSFRLRGMKTVLRLRHTDETLAFRYFFERVYDAGALGGNYILARRSAGAIDFLIPEK